MNTILKKIFREVLYYKGRTLLALLGVFVGISAIGAVLTAYSILDREMNRNYMDTNPASVVFKVSNLDNDAISIIKKYDSKLDIELRKTVQARISRGDGTYGTIYLRGIEQFDNQKVDTFTLEKGKFPQNELELVIERDCLKILRNIKDGVDENIFIKLPLGLEKEMKITGIVHAPGLAPASMENYSYGFVTLECLKGLGYKGWYDEIRIVCHEDRFERPKMRLLSEKLSKLLSEKGYVVDLVDVPVPGKHPHADQLNSLLFLLQAFAVVSLLAACLIIINLISFIMSRQVKQIAIMKAIGASVGNIAFPFTFYVVLISIAALGLSFPVSTAIGNGYSNFAASILNFKISSYEVPLWVFVIQIAIGILIPLLSAVYPIYLSCTRNVREGLLETVESSSSIKNTRKDIRKDIKKPLIFKSVKSLMPLKNLLRKRYRTLFAVLALLAGGVLFMTSLNINASIEKTVSMSAKDFRWDYNIVLAGNYPENKLNEILSGIKGLDYYEIWRGNNAQLEKDSSSVNCNIRIIPQNSCMVNLSLAEVLYKTKDSIIVNNGLAKDEKWIKPGKSIKMLIGGKKAEVIVSDIVNEVPALPTVYMTVETYDRIFGGNCRQMVLAGTNLDDIYEQRKITKAFEAQLKSKGVEISENWNIYVLRKAFADHLLLIVTFLSVMSMFAIGVGGLSIASSIGINISERKRELGVLRAIGANRHQMISLILSEVVAMALISWIAGVAVSYPVSKWAGNYFGQIFLGTNLQNTMSIGGAILWLVISFAVSVVAGFVPSWKTTSEPLREVLSYE